MVWQPSYHSVCERNKILNYLSCCGLRFFFFFLLPRTECSRSTAELSNDVSLTDVLGRIFVTEGVGLYCTSQGVIFSLYPLDDITIPQLGQRMISTDITRCPLGREGNRASWFPEAEPAKAWVNEWVFLCTEWSRWRMLLLSLWGSFSCALHSTLS